MHSRLYLGQLLNKLNKIFSKGAKAVFPPSETPVEHIIDFYRCNY